MLKIMKEKMTVPVKPISTAKKIFILVAIFHRVQGNSFVFERPNDRLAAFAVQPLVAQFVARAHQAQDLFGGVFRKFDRAEPTALRVQFLNGLERNHDGNAVADQVLSRFAFVISARDWRSWFPFWLGLLEFGCI